MGKSLTAADRTAGYTSHEASSTLIIVIIYNISKVPACLARRPFKGAGPVQLVTGPVHSQNHLGALRSIQPGCHFSAQEESQPDQNDLCPARCPHFNLLFTVFK